MLVLAGVIKFQCTCFLDSPSNAHSLEDVAGDALAHLVRSSPERLSALRMFHKVSQKVGVPTFVFSSVSKKGPAFLHSTTLDMFLGVNKIRSAH